jgi:hypothetical protein
MKNLCIDQFETSPPGRPREFELFEIWLITFSTPCAKMSSNAPPPSYENYETVNTKSTKYTEMFFGKIAKFT